jgi:hypothetical protein
VTTIIEHMWRFEVDWQLSAFVGAGGGGAEETIQLLGRKGATELMTSSKISPAPQSRVHPPIDVRLTFFFQQTEPAATGGAAAGQPNLKSVFRINRADKACRTPRRNPLVDSALEATRDLHVWAGKVSSRLDDFVRREAHGLDRSAINDAGIFVPVVPLFEVGKRGEPVDAHLLEPQQQDQQSVVPASASASSSSSVVPAQEGSALLPADDTPRLLDEHKRTLQSKADTLARVFPSADSVNKILTVREAVVGSLLVHIQRLTQAYSDGVEFIELMLRRQLVAAVGKELTASDFASYWDFHARKIFREEFAPQPLCFAIRRPEHSPEGVVSIDVTASSAVGVLSSGASTGDPVVALTRSMDKTWPMKFELNAATNVEFRGERFLHAIVAQQFGGQGLPNLTLTARARQFSSFLVLVGTLSGSDLFQPKHAMLLQNRDELRIPLDLKVIPSAGEFREAVSSISPEQQRFAKAIRSMQLEGSMFGVLVIQIKPQLEKLLRLPSDALTKEIQLTQDLMRLFVEFQIPSDLLAFAGRRSADKGRRLAQVGRQVRRLLKMIQKEKDKELRQREQEARMARAAELARVRAAEKEKRRLEKESRRALLATKKRAACKDSCDEGGYGGGEAEEVKKSFGSGMALFGKKRSFALSSSSSSSSAAAAPGSAYNMRSMDSATIAVAKPTAFTFKQLQAAPSTETSSSSSSSSSAPSTGNIASSSASAAAACASPAEPAAPCDESEQDARSDGSASVVGGLRPDAPAAFHAEVNCDQIAVPCVEDDECEEATSDQMHHEMMPSRELAEEAAAAPKLQCMARMMHVGSSSMDEELGADKKYIEREEAGLSDGARKKGKATTWMGRLTGFLGGGKKEKASRTDPVPFQASSSASMVCGDQMFVMGDRMDIAQDYERPQTESDLSSEEEDEEPAEESPEVTPPESEDDEPAGDDGENELVEEGAGAAANDGRPFDWTALPVALDAKLLALDDEQALRPTIITAGSTWTKRSQKSLLAPPATSTLSAEEQDRSRTEAFDLLDALSRSGSLPIDCAELHVVMACTHNFTKSLIDTVVQDNVNPIEKVERSALILATTVHDKQPSELIKPEQRERIATYSRVVFLEEEKQRALLAASTASEEGTAASSSSSLGSA